MSRDVLPPVYHGCVMPRNIDEHDQVGARLEIEEDVAKSDRPCEVPLPTELKYAIRAHTDDHAPDEPISQYHHH